MAERVNLFFPIIVILVLASISIIVYNVLSNTDPDAVTDDVRQELQEQANIPQPEELSDEERESKIGECDSRASVHQKDWCYLELAKRYRLDVCARMVQDDFKRYCSAIIAENARECYDIATGTMQDACYITLAQQMIDASLCEKTDKVAFCKSQLPQ